MGKVKNGFMWIGLLFTAALLINAVLPGEEGTGVTSVADTENKNDPYSISAIPIPKDIHFAGEKVPVEEPDIKERLDKELLVNTYWQSNALLLIKRSKKYFPVIEPILKANGIPEDFKYLAVAESGLQNVVSPAGATGFWQLMKATAREHGLEVNENVDERYHLKKSTEAACEYLKQAKERFGSWTLAAAAYNAGRAGVLNQQGRQKVNNYYDLLLGEETGRYVFRILALKEILSDPDKYGFKLEKEDYYQWIPTYELEIDEAVANFADFSKKHGINYKILKIHNPWLREAFLVNNSRKKYVIELPQKGHYKTITK
ncbi:lytic transglycosylase domain-containing protein [Ascidiimonas aurantiaca]|uniref:lytic transglycosylase domain-containing protein n=1 Tax=Ascidiimonas aurantiaca TaxID=1685432 RepID=UPI0030EEC033